MFIEIKETVVVKTGQAVHRFLPGTNANFSCYRPKDAPELWEYKLVFGTRSGPIITHVERRNSGDMPKWL